MFKLNLDWAFIARRIRSSKITAWRLRSFDWELKELNWAWRDAFPSINKNKQWPQYVARLYYRPWTFEKVNFDSNRFQTCFKTHVNLIGFLWELEKEFWCLVSVVYYHSIEKIRWLVFVFSNNSCKKNSEQLNLTWDLVVLVSS